MERMKGFTVFLWHNFRRLGVFLVSNVEQPVLCLKNHGGRCLHSDKGCEMKKSSTMTYRVLTGEQGLNQPAEG